MTRKDGGNVILDFEPPTRDYYDAKVVVPADAKVDPRGPYPDPMPGP